MTGTTGSPKHRTLAIGDVHGCDSALAKLLNQVLPRAGDTVVFLGDLVDRGPDTKRVLDIVLDLQRRCRVVFILGNHEEMMLDALNGGDWRPWMTFGGREAFHSYGGTLAGIPPNHIELLQSGQNYWETPSHIFVHANLKPGLPLVAQPDVMLRWAHLTGEEQPYDTERRVICGHTPQPDGYPLEFPGWVCLDTDCQRGGWLTCLDVEDNQVWQSNEIGQTREFPLGWREPA